MNEDLFKYLKTGLKILNSEDGDEIVSGYDDPRIDISIELCIKVRLSRVTFEEASLFTPLLKAYTHTDEVHCV